MTKARRCLTNWLCLSFFSLVLGVFGVLPAFATDGIYTKFGLDLGYAGRIGYPGPEWAIYVYGAGTANSRLNTLNISAPTNATPFTVDGDIAVAGAYSSMIISGNTTINGDIYRRTTATFSRSGNSSNPPQHFSASIDSDLAGGITSLQNVSNQAALLTSTAGSPTSINLGKGQHLFFTNTGNPFNGKFVMNLSNFVMGGGSTLTLDGAAGSAFVLNITGKFDISGASKISLTGGLTVSDVLFNVRGNNSTFSISGNSVFNGTLLAYNPSGAQRTLQITGHDTEVNGEVLAHKITLQSGAHVKKPKEKSKHKDDDDDIASPSPRH